jgi:transketolase
MRVIRQYEQVGKLSVAYQQSVLPPDVTARVPVEQASVFGWGRFVGIQGQAIGMKSFGAPASIKGID